jgi:hypothetical protein
MFGIDLESRSDDALGVRVSWLAECLSWAKAVDSRAGGP